MKKDIFQKNVHALCCVEFKEMGCSVSKKDAEKDYFLTKKEILKIAKQIK